MTLLFIASQVMQVVQMVVCLCSSWQFDPKTANLTCSLHGV